MATCGFIILVNIIVTPILKFLCHRYPGKFPQMETWIQEGLLQIQRKAYEGQNQGRWQNRQEDVPTTLYQENLPLLSDQNNSASTFEFPNMSSKSQAHGHQRLRNLSPSLHTLASNSARSGGPESLSTRGPYAGQNAGSNGYAQEIRPAPTASNSTRKRDSATDRSQFPGKSHTTPKNGGEQR